jgi:tetratricopeptide (TPR) repeat protein
MIESALERTEPLSWIDGWSQLDPDQRANTTLVTAKAERRIARERGARWTVAGVVARHGDSATVVLRLNDVSGDSVVRQASVTKPAAQVAQAGLEAVNALLPTILAPGRRIDLSALTDRRPAALASWLQGEREYRLGNFDTALVYLRRSVDEDSALAVASLRAAQAASWKGLPEAMQFADLALAHVELLPARQVDFARGLAAYLKGEADSAVRWLNLALAISPDWTEANMTLGEVYQHFLPRVPGSLDSLAKFEFQAAAVDTGFAPPLFHLAEIEIRGGDPHRASESVRRFERFGGGSQERRELALMLTCARARNLVDWHAATSVSPIEVLTAAKLLSIAGAFPGCVEDATRSILATPTATDQHWGAVMLLQDVLAAQRKPRAIIQLVDSLRTAAFWQPTLFYVINALAGLGEFNSKVAETFAALRRAYGSQYEDTISDNTRLLLGTWYARTSRLADAERLERLITRSVARDHNPVSQREANALSAHILLAQGDSDAALNVFERLSSVSSLEDLQWGYAQSFPAERQSLAALLFARGRFQDALDVSANFDHPTPTVYVAFLPASLALRHRAAQALARPQQAERYRSRLVGLGRLELLNSPQ